MSVIQPSSCSIFVQIWVDTNALQNGSTEGVYLVDNNVSNGSSKEGTPDLDSNIPNGTNICWTVLNVDPTWDGTLSISNMGNSSVFGASGTPQQVNSSTWTGQVQATGTASYNINFAAQASGGSGITTNVNPTLSVH